jgi:hypothetical protein
MAVHKLKEHGCGQLLTGETRLAFAVRVEREMTRVARAPRLPKALLLTALADGSRYVGSAGTDTPPFASR